MKAHGFQNIKIYNGGIKDWVKSGHPIESIEPLPTYEGKFVTAEELHKLIFLAASRDCVNEEGLPMLTILDLRTEHHFNNKKRPPVVKTGCNMIFCLLDDLRKADLRKRIPKKELTVTITETGNRDKFVMQYLSQFGYKNVKGLTYGMRGWIKADYPIADAKGIISK